MSQSGVYSPIGGGGGGVVFTLTGNIGGAVPPDGAGNINLVGADPITVTGNPGTDTLTISLTNPLPIANGGTNATSMANTFGVNYYDGTRLVTTTVGTSTNVLTSNGVGVAPTFQAIPGIFSNSFVTSSGTATPSGGVINVTQGSNILTTGATNVVTIALVSSPSVSGSLTAGTTVTAGTGITATTGNITATAGNVIITLGRLTLPSTNAALTQGVITLNGVVFMSNFGTNNTFLGGAGNGTMTGGQNVGIGRSTLLSLAGGGSNVAVGSATLQLLTSGGSNTAVGASAGQNIVGASGNTLLGQNAGNSLSSGGNNTIIGSGAGASGGSSYSNSVIIGNNALKTVTGSSNTAIGSGAANNMTSGASNILIGINAASALTTSESSNIIIGNAGVIADNNTIRIGTQGSGAGQQNLCFIAGITGVTVASSAAVLLNTSTGQLGTIISSRTVKENIEDLGHTSDIIYDLRPVKFNFIKDESKVEQWGLIAEEVQEIFPDLAVRDSEGNPTTVRYHDLPILLLNELQKLRAYTEELEDRIHCLEFKG